MSLCLAGIWGGRQILLWAQVRIRETESRQSTCCFLPAVKRPNKSRWDTAQRVCPGISTRSCPCQLKDWVLTPFFFFLFSVYSPQKVVCNILEYFCWANCIKQGLSFYTASGRPSQPSWGIMALALSRSTYRVKIRLPACLPILFKLKALSIYKSSELK